MREAYRAATADTARKKLRGLVSWLESNGHEDAAASLREGLEETITVVKLDLPPALRRSLATTNNIENLIRRWASFGLLHAEKRFRRIKGYREMPKLVSALRKADTQVEVA
jgi:putative transposase